MNKIFMNIFLRGVLLYHIQNYSKSNRKKERKKHFPLNCFFDFFSTFRTEISTGVDLAGIFRSQIERYFFFIPDNLGLRRPPFHLFSLWRMSPDFRTDFQRNLCTYPRTTRRFATSKDIIWVRCKYAHIQ